MIEHAVLVRALEGGVSGDRAVIVQAPDGAVLVGAIDGLGHGPLAAEAADAAAAVVEAAPGAPLEQLFERCHEALERTRGAVMTLGRFTHPGELEWVGVGNVEARLVRAGAPPGTAQSPVLFGGVLGHQLRTARSSTVALAPGDVLLMATDGVRGDFVTGLSVAGPVAAIAERVLEHSGKRHDDALVVVARFLGPALP